MDQNLLRAYFSTVYELPSPEGMVRASLDGELSKDGVDAAPVLGRTFAILTAYNPRSMLLPRRINEQRHQVMRELLILAATGWSSAWVTKMNPKSLGANRPGWCTTSIAKRPSISVEPFAKTRLSIPATINPN